MWLGALLAAAAGLAWALLTYGAGAGLAALAGQPALETKLRSERGRGRPLPPGGVAAAPPVASRGIPAGRKGIEGMRGRSDRHFE